MIRELLNTLYVQTQGSYLKLNHETLVLDAPEQEPFQVPLHHLGSLALFGNVLVSPFLMHRCAEDNRPITWFDFNGRFKARLQGPTTGNVLLRQAQHRAMESPQACLALARCFVEGKIRNARFVVQKARREEAGDLEVLERGEGQLENHAKGVPDAQTLDELRGIEGMASVAYFGCMNALVVNPDPFFQFTERNRRPPRDAINALLSFAYALLAKDCSGALEGVGLDPQVGYLHALRPGRPALGLDLMEEFRAVVADRAVLTLLNRNQLQKRHFEQRPGGAVNLTEEGRKIFLKHWQERKKTDVQHGVLRESMPQGLLPHVQARLLARTLRGDLRDYPPYVAR